MSSTLDSAIGIVQGVNQTNVAAAAAAREEQAEIASANADLFGWGATSPTVQQTAPLEPAQPAADDGGMGLWGAPAPAPPPAMPPTSSHPSMASQPSMADDSHHSAHSSVPDRGSLSSVGGMEPPAPALAPTMEAPAAAWGESSVIPSVAQPSVQHAPHHAPMPSDLTDATPFGAAPQQQRQQPAAGQPFGMAYGAPTTPAQPPAEANPNPYGVTYGGPDAGHNRTDSWGLGLGMMGMGGTIPHTPGSSFVEEPQQQLQQQQVPPPQQAAPPAPAPPPSPSKSEMEAMKRSTIKAEGSFRSSAELVRTLSTEVRKLESAAKSAEEAKASLEGKKKKLGGKKKAKKEYERALQIAAEERSRADEAKAQLRAAEREAEKARKEMEAFRTKMEEMEIEAAKAASYAQSTEATAQRASENAGQMAPPPPQPPVQQQQFQDPFGGGGGDYANPFL